MPWRGLRDQLLYDIELMPTMQQDFFIKTNRNV